MDKVLVTTLLTVASVVAAVMVVNGLLPSVSRSSSAVLSSSAGAAEQIKTNVSIIHVAGDTTANEVYVWIKNTGSADVKSINLSDVFFKTSTSFDRLPHGSGATYWDFAIEGGSEAWSPGVTLKATLYLTSLTSGTYTVRYVTQNGVAVEKEFSV